MVVFWVDIFGLQNGIDFEILRIVYLIKDCFVRGLCFSDCVLQLSGAFGCVVRLVYDRGYQNETVMQCVI